MNLELLTCRRLSAAILHPPVSLSRSELALLFSAFSERFDVSSLSYLPDGARFSQGETEILVQTGRTQVTFDFTTHFQGLRDRVLEAFRMVAERLNPTGYSAYGNKLIAFQPVEGSSAELLERGLLSVSSEKLQRLGPGRRGTGFRFNFHREAIYDLRIEPFFADLSQIYIELDVNYPQPFGNLEEIAPLMGRSYDYLLGDVRAFLGDLERGP